ncbi:IS3 family transposase [Kocuria flava]|uniref:IS3 family transposase n=1 Tax=Kocuria flava TaxID=446860 RepID=UPI003F1D6EAB
MEFIDAEKTVYGVRRLCRVLGVSKSAYYEHRRREGGPSVADVADAHEAHQARVAWAEHRRVYGARRLTSELRHRGHSWNRKKVAEADASERHRGRPPSPPRRIQQTIGLNGHGPGLGRAAVHRLGAEQALGR